MINNNLTRVSRSWELRGAICEISEVFVLLKIIYQKSDVQCFTITAQFINRYSTDIRSCKFRNANL